MRLMIRCECHDLFSLLNYKIINTTFSILFIRSKWIIQNKLLLISYNYEGPEIIIKCFSHENNKFFLLINNQLSRLY